MLCAAVAAAGKACEPRLVPALTRVLEREAANNHATHLAVDALIAIGARHGAKVVRAGLEQALRVTGFGADQLHAKARAALAKDG